MELFLVFVYLIKRLNFAREDPNKPHYWNTNTHRLQMPHYHICYELPKETDNVMMSIGKSSYDSVYQVKTAELQIFNHGYLPTCFINDFLRLKDHKT
jgi:hypothetical protein